MKALVILAVAFLVCACARTSVLDIESDTIQISASAAPVCGQTGAQQVAAKRAAIETLKRGYDKYIVQDAAYQNDVRVVGTTPYVANSYGSGNISGYGNTATYSGQSTTYVTGGQPIIGGSHNQDLIVRMFKSGDAGSERAVDARRVLGPDWQEQVNSSANGTC